MTKTQLTMTAQMLELAIQIFSNHGCNDFEIDNTPDNLEFVKGMIAKGDYPDEPPHISQDGKTIYVMDTEVMGYCRRLLLDEAAK